MAPSSGIFKAYTYINIHIIIKKIRYVNSTVTTSYVRALQNAVVEKLPVAQLFNKFSKFEGLFTP